MRTKLCIVYDGQCPLCHAGVSYYKADESQYDIELVDARRAEDHPIMAKIKDANINLDKGMVVEHRGQLYHGALALNYLARIGTHSDLINALNRSLFTSKLASNIFYPILLIGRSIALKIKQCGLINNLS